MIHLYYANICSSCPVVYDRREHANCPICGDYSVLHLATILNRREKARLRVVGTPSGGRP